jgi:hypothetical protein
MVHGEGKKQVANDQAMHAGELRLASVIVSVQYEAVCSVDILYAIPKQVTVLFSPQKYH